MKELLFATSNPNKLKEVREILGSNYSVKSLTDIGWEDEIPEPFGTIKENSVHKANYFYKKTGLNCISEDSGLEVHALGNKPSAYSARYAGDDKNDARNIEKILLEMNGVEDRTARFVSIFTYKTGDNCISFEGEMLGTIIENPRGTGGFGYDPIFLPNDSSKTNAELTTEEKNAISHRKKALKSWINYMNSSL